jgi:SAM-dependent methyltransferase
MAHYQQLKFVKTVRDFFPTFFSKKKVLEIGSWNVTGSVRQFFTECSYVGVDVSEGPGVDLVALGQCIELPDKSFDVVISCECFEHNPAWVDTFNNMYRMLKDDGLFVLTCATYGRREHGTPRRSMNSSLTSAVEGGAYYLNLSFEDVTSAISIPSKFSNFKFFYNPYSCDLYFLGIKSGEGSDNADSFDKISLEVNKIKKNCDVGFFEDLVKKIEFKTLFILTKLIGDKRYQDIRHVISNKSKSLP